MSLLDRAEDVAFAPVLDGLDSVRHRVLRRGARMFAPFIRDRDRRVIAGALLACATALGGAALAPGYVLLLGPVLLGMPHLFFEARYLFFQHADLRRAALVAILVAQSVLVFAGIGIYTLGVACIAALAVTGMLATRRGLALALLAVLVEAAALVGPDWSRFLLLHGHNCLALAVWLAWRKRPTRVSIAVAACFVAGTVAIAIGCFDGLPLRRPFGEATFSITHITDAVAAGFGGPWRKRLLVFFLFAQAFHYAVWLRLIPEEARPRETPRTWRASWQAFKADAGAATARLTVALSLAVPLAALVGGLVRTRALYVTASEFHATVEAILVAVVLARGAPSRGGIRQYWPDRSPAERRRALLAQWSRLRRALALQIAWDYPRIPATSTLAEFKRHEDAMDALLCAWAGMRYLAGRARAHGDATAAVWA